MITFIITWWFILGLLSFRILLVAHTMSTREKFIKLGIHKDLIEAVDVIGFGGNFLDNLIFCVVMLGHMVLGGLLFVYIMVELPDEHVRLNLK